MCSGGSKVAQQFRRKAKGSTEAIAARRERADRRVAIWSTSHLLASLSHAERPCIPKVYGRQSIPIEWRVKLSDSKLSRNVW